MKAAILGGTFNPVHHGHLFLAEEVCAQLGYDAVIFVPAFLPVHKDASSVIPAHHRLAMLRLALQANPRFLIDAGELERGGPSYSIDSVPGLISRHDIEGRPGFVIGDDLAAGFPAWKRPGDLASIVDLIVARRTLAGPLHLEYPHRTVTNTILPISSSEIRRRIAEGGAVRYLLPDDVLAYIRDNTLYG
jgi:nicotinate-nucleotide adenylyltransferase